MFYSINKRFLLRLLCFVFLSTVSLKIIAHKNTSNKTAPIANQNLIAGEQAYIQCSGCHSPAYNRTGPKHCDLFGRQAGTLDGYEFSEAMRNSKIIWNEETLNAFLQAPLSNLPGTSMGFVGIQSDRTRQQLITYLISLTANNPVCAP